MQTPTNFKISIPKPCHEDWNKFTPDEKGAFCKVCSKSVHDFTKKSAEEISTILIDEMSAGKKVCGRFNEDQLEAPALKGEKAEFESVERLDTYSLNFHRMKKFALALFLVFGGYLFNTARSSAQKMIMGKMKYVEPVRGEVSIRKDSIVTTKDTTAASVPQIKTCSQNTMPKGDVQIEPIEQQQILGSVRALPVEKTIIKGNAIVASPIVGQAEITQQPVEETRDSVVTVERLVDTNNGPESTYVETDEPIEVYTVVKDIPVSAEDPIATIEAPTDMDIDPLESADSVQADTTPIIMGFMVVMPQDITKPDTVVPDSTLPVTYGELAVEDSAFVETTQSDLIPGPSPSGEGGTALECYPNPSATGEITLRYNLKKDGTASISLFNLNGNLVKTLLPAQSIYASSYETRYDVSDLKDGIYFCELISGNNKTTTRIVISK